MARIDVPRIILTGLHRGVGKTTIALALMFELKRRGVQVRAAVTRPDLNIAALYERITGFPTPCLDPQLLTQQQVLEGLDRAATGAEFLVIDGAGGLLDTEESAFGCDADLARFTHTPILFVADVAQYGTTLGAVIRGVAQAARDIEWAGIALNNFTPSFSGRAELVSALQQNQVAPPLVSLPRLDPLPPVIPNGVRQGRNDTLLDRSFLVHAADALLGGSDIEQLVARASVAPMLECEIPAPPSFQGIELAVARDNCFCLFFQDNLEMLRRAGVRLLEFSPLTDGAVPDGVQGLYLPGGFLGEYGAELAGNEPFRDSVRALAQRGGVVVAEGASVALLANKFYPPMSDGALVGLGVFGSEARWVGDSASAEAGARVAHADGALLEYGILGESGEILRGVYPLDWKFERPPTGQRVLRVVPGAARAVLEGYCPSPNVFGSFGLWHWGSNAMVIPSLASTLRSMRGDSSPDSSYEEP